MFIFEDIIILLLKDSFLGYNTRLQTATEGGTGVTDGGHVHVVLGLADGVFHGRDGCMAVLTCLLLDSRPKIII